MTAGVFRDEPAQRVPSAAFRVEGLPPTWIVPALADVRDAEAAGWPAWIQLGANMPETWGAGRSWQVLWLDARQRVVQVSHLAPHQVGARRQAAVVLVWIDPAWALPVQAGQRVRVRRIRAEEA